MGRPMVLQFVHNVATRNLASPSSSLFPRPSNRCALAPPSRLLNAVMSSSSNSSSSSFSLPRKDSSLSSSSSSSSSQPTPPSSPQSPPSPSPSMPNNNAASAFDTLSKATIIGRTGSVPDIRQLPSGVRCANVNVATNHLAGPMQQQRVETQWHTVQVYESVTGFHLLSALPPGTQLYVEGALRISTYEKDGVSKQYVNIVVNKSLGMFRILRRPYRSNDEFTGSPQDQSPSTNSSSSSLNFPF